ncbi:hypothetical protein F2P81_004296 [Scophthalmus maximus]|uniref:Uncharacterized protein n=1 Tax=Scophthalmus maximus TaxID=52904 RepID=A0A6A4TDH8_SCOMX|nr:hypothetical protein F2P81_004296 [Scophthalmus maximus]
MFATTPCEVTSEKSKRSTVYEEEGKDHKRHSLRRSCESSEGGEEEEENSSHPYIVPRSRTGTSVCGTEITWTVTHERIQLPPFSAQGPASAALQLTVSQCQILHPDAGDARGEESLRLPFHGCGCRGGGRGWRRLKCEKVKPHRV